VLIVFIRIDLRLACLLISVVISTLDYSVLSVALPTLAQSLSISVRDAQMTASLYLLGSAITFIPLAYCANTWGSARIFKISIFALVILSSALVFTTNFHIFLLLRFLEGIAGAGIVGLVPGIAVAIFPERRAWALSLIISASAAGTIIGPLLGGFFVEYFGWRSIFLLNLPLGLLAFSLSHNLPNLDKIKLKEAFVKLLKLPKFFLALLASMLFFTYTFGQIIIVPFYLASRGYTPSQTSFFLLIPSLIVIFLASFCGIQADRFGLKKITILGSAILAVSSSWQGLTGEVLIGAFGLGIGRCFFQSANSAKILSLAPRGAESLASTLLSITRVLGQALGSIISGWLWTTLAVGETNSAFASVNFFFAFLALVVGLLAYFR
jgi:MFS transporter, DHA2 family, multidrug resistance protein